MIRCFRRGTRRARGRAAHVPRYEQEKYLLQHDSRTAGDGWRLRALLVADHDRMVQFAEWLQSQPAKQEILARLAAQGALIVMKRRAQAVY
jgi:hypothetical protein